MAAAWPAFLQQRLNEAGFSYLFGDTVLRSQNDTGPIKRRRRTTKSVDKIQCTVNIKYSDFTDFYDFWDVTLNGGVTPFTFNHPFTQVPADFYMAEPPRMSPLGGLEYTLSMVWETVP